MERLDRIEKAISKLKTENSIVAESKPMNLKEVVAYMGTSTSAIYKLTSTAEIPHYKLGKKLFFKKEKGACAFARWAAFQPGPDCTARDRAPRQRGAVLFA